MVLDIPAALIRCFQLRVKLTEYVLQRLAADIGENVQTTSEISQQMFNQTEQRATAICSVIRPQRTRNICSHKYPQSTNC